jgi:hypothetical protein
MRFPNYVLESVKKYISDAIARVDINRYNHETAYINAILAKLDGVAYHDQTTHIEFMSTIATDRGPNCAESKYGADFALTCNIMMPDNTIINKAVLGQAKKGKISELSNSEKRRLNIQADSSLKCNSQWWFGITHFHPE